MTEPLLTLPEPLWTADELAAATGGRWAKPPGSSWLPTGITYMRRLQFLKPGDIFVTMDMATRRKVENRRALTVNEWDTADELPTYIAAGISTVIAQRDLKPMGLPLLRVENSGQAVLDLARAARARFQGRAISITGTVGKSTTKEMLRHVLAKQGPTYATMANYNSYFGVPLCLAQTPRNARFAVYENAISSLYQEKGPISLLVRPHVGIFTAIGRGFENHVATMEDIADLKSLMFKGLEPGGIAIINADMPLSERVRGKALAYGATRVVSFGEDVDADVRLLEIERQPEHSRVIASVHGERIVYEVPLPGKPMVMNSLSVLAAVHAVGADWRLAATDLASYETSEGRLRRFRVPLGRGDFELIDDGFSAEQASMIANFEVLSLSRPGSGGRRIAVLGEIGGLTNPQETHAELAGPLMAAGIDKVFTYGENLKALRSALPQELLGAHSDNPGVLAAAVLDEVKPGDVVSAKGCSVTSGFERVMNGLKSGRPDPILASPAAANGHPAAAEPSGTSLRSPTKIGIAFLGDTYFGETFQKRREANGKTNYLAARGYGYPLKLLNAFLQRQDFAVANLEASLGPSRPSPLADKKKRILRGEADETLRTLQLANLGALSLANDHSIGHGPEGLAETIEAVRSRGLLPFGAGADDRAAERPLHIDARVGRQSIAIHVVSAYEYDDQFNRKLKAYAAPDRPGVAGLNGLADRIKALKAAEPDGLVIVYPHWGAAHSWRSQQQADAAATLIAAGADLIIGHGSHALQEIDRVDGRWVVYGLGNFIFNSDGDYEQHGLPHFSLMARLELVAGEKGATRTLLLYPVLTNNQSTLFRPRFCSAAEFARLLTELQSRSPGLAGGGVATGCDADGWHVRLTV